MLNTLDPDQARLNVGLDLGQKLFGTLIAFLKEDLKKLILEKKYQETTNNHEKNSMQCVNRLLSC